MMLVCTVYSSCHVYVGNIPFGDLCCVVMCCCYSLHHVSVGFMYHVVIVSIGILYVQLVNVVECPESKFV